ncbi:hypothetical protein [Adhaeretor mobilis]|uniref:Uncharacterized protein n=1 Tax=Adhaeretor mobilis TaxID=1930276 RepID=A0A517MR14_9BACT|nr:hypothetical protein [Adhaeretor mobilis]QDS97326.1 hypothetical protein HG15A2_05870 [Adhaeretor mobilis]
MQAHAQAVSAKPVPDRADANQVDAPVDTAQAKRAYRLLKIGVVATLALSCAIPVSLNLVDPDLWGHVQYGQDWLEDGHLHRTATHTYTAVDHPWINHENAAELVFALGYEKLGIYPLVLLKCLLGLGILTTMALVARLHGVKMIAAWALLLLVAANLQAFFPLRPQLLSFLLFTIAMVCVDRGFAFWYDEGRSGSRMRLKWLLPLPMIFAVWVNSHGAFVAGLAIVGTLLAGRMIEAWLREGRDSLKTQITLAFVGLSCIAATFVNPYGLGMHEWLLNSLGEPRPEITEWAAPSMSDPVFWPFVTLALVVVSCLVGTKRTRDWPQIVVFALVGWQAASHLRHIAFFALLAGFWLPGHFQSAIARLRPTGNKKLAVVLPSRRVRSVMSILILGAMTLQSIALFGRLSNFQVSRDKYPVDAMQYMVDHGVQGRVVVNFNWAQYAIAALSPHSTVAFDGRFRTCYPQEVVDMHFDFIFGEQKTLRHRSKNSPTISENQFRILDHHSPDIVLLDRSYTNAADVLQQVASRPSPEWTMLYRDEIAEVWGRTVRFANPASEDFIPIAMRVENNTPLQGALDWPALPDYSKYKQVQAFRAQRDDASQLDQVSNRQKSDIGA